jgi:hypothetical protein
MQGDATQLTLASRPARLMTVMVGLSALALRYQLRARRCQHLRRCLQLLLSFPPRLNSRGWRHAGCVYVVKRV